jgi:hypothetical protein
MRATFVVHEASPNPDRGGALNVTLRPVVNEDQTNRDWSPGGSPAGELRLTVSNADLAKKLVVGRRLDVTMDLGDVSATETTGQFATSAPAPAPAPAASPVAVTASTKNK